MTAGVSSGASGSEEIDDEAESSDAAIASSDDDDDISRRRRGSVVRHAPRGLPAAIGRIPRPVIPTRPDLVSRSMGASAGASYFLARETRGVVRTFLDVRGTHLAALIAFYALLAFFPLALIAVAILGFFGEQSETSFVIEQLNTLFPGVSERRLVTTVNEFRDQAVYLAAVGGGAVLWSSLGLFSALESAFNLVYGHRNRPFARGKALMFVILVGSVAAIFVALIVGSLGVEFLVRVGGTGTSVAYGFAIALMSVIIFGILWVAYRVLPNAHVSWKQALPGTCGATAALVGSFQAVPLFVRATDNLIALRAFGGATLLLIWLFLMANIIVIGAVVNWRLSRGARQRAAEAAAAAQEAARSMAP